MRESRCMSLLPRTTLHSDSEQFSLLISNRQFIHTLFWQLSVVSTAANESILALLSKQTESLYPPCDMRCLDCFPRQWLGLAIFSSACLNLAADQSPKLKNLSITLIHITAKITHSMAQQLYSRLQKKSPSRKKWDTAFHYYQGDFEWIFRQFFCIRLLLYLSTTVRKIKNPFFYIPYIHCNFFPRWKKTNYFFVRNSPVTV
jgi:hypothetical protein